MSPLSCICVIVAISGVLAARWRATDLSNGQLYFLVGMFFLASILIRRYVPMLPRVSKPPFESTRASGPPDFIPYAKELNDSLFELYKPLDTPSSMSVIFLHGLQSEHNIDPHLSTWKSGDGSCLWPQTWLIEEFPGAHVLSVSYNAHVKRHEQREFDISNIGENLLSDILQVDIGQAPYCPVILVGHCFGGFVIKELCNRAFDAFTRASDLRKKGKLGMLLGNIRGIYYYGTPHHGSPLMGTNVRRLGSNLLEYFKLLSTAGARLNEKFEQLRKLYPNWRIHGLGESRSTESGLFQGIVGAPEGSSRAGDRFNSVDADHFQICRPEKKTSRSFSGLVELLESIAADVKEERARAQEEEAQAAERSRLQNLQRLPKQITGIEDPVEEVKTKLVESRSLGLVGMGGCGKTTLAKAVFNKLVSGFEYSAFVREVKLISGREGDLKKEVWSQVRHFGKEMDANPKWSLLNQKSLLLVLDDVSTDRDLEVLLDIAEYLSPESRFLVTSRDRDLLKTLEGMYEVPLLDEGIANELFMRHAFPEKMAAPSELGSLVGAIVGKCDGLPLTLEIIGKYLYKRDDKQDWEQTLIALGRADSVTGLNEKLWEKLKLSFDGLQEKEQQIFLDVATFFCGNRICTLGEAKVAWKAAYGLANERLLWRTLVDRSLVYDVEDSEIIQMHEQLRDLGRKLGANHKNMPRIWNEKEARDLLELTSQRHEKLQEIFALRLDESRSAELPLRIARTTFLSLTEMRYLEVDANATISGGQEDEVTSFLEKLVFVHLQCVQDQFTSVFFGCTILTRLVILHLDGYKEDYLPESFSSMSALKTLKLVDCPELRSLPKSFGQLSELIDLEVNDCCYLQSLPESFGQLSKLIHLEFNDCLNLQSLPESFGQLSALRDLQLERCHTLQSLPESFGQLSALRDLRLGRYILQSLPESFGLLSALSNLQFDCCYNLQSLPESFGQLSALSDLQLKHCKRLESLPGSFGQLSALSNLRFSNCNNLQILPESFGQLSALSDLELEYCERLESLPGSFGQLSALRHLSLEMVALRGVPDSIRSLPSLQVLELGCLPFVKEFPAWLGKEEAGLRKMLRKTFDVRDGNFALSEQRIVGEYDFENVTGALHGQVLNMVLSSNFATHCDKCGMYPLEWPRYKSSPSGTQFCDALCPNCFQQSGSNAPEYTHEDSPVHCYVSCDGCDMKPLKGPRYKSSTRYNFDLCQDCFRRSSSNASEYICSEPSVLSAGDGTMDMLDAILNLDADDRNSEIHWSSERVQVRVFIFQERGILKLQVGDLRGALDDLNKALEIVLGQTSSEFGFLENVRYRCLKHGAYVKFLLGDIDGARCDAQEALSIGWSEFSLRGVLHISLGFNSLDHVISLPVRFLDLEMR